MKLFISHKIEARVSPLGGYGVFAKEPISAGEKLEVNHFTEIPVGYLVPHSIMSIAYGFPKGTGNLVIVHGLACIYNSSNSGPECSADWQTDAEHRVFVHFAVRDINQDEEILIFYNNYEFNNLKKDE